MDTLSRTWELLGQSFKILKSDKELMWLPILSFVFCMTATVTIWGIGLLAYLPPGAFPQDEAQQRILARHMTPFMFLFYFVTYGLTVYFNVALVSIASNRLGGGNATLNDGLQAAWEHKWSIVQWALLSATFGTLMQIVERQGFLGRAAARTAGLMWGLASFFIAPVLAAEDIGPMNALYKSAQLFRKTWGEQVAGGFSFPLVFLLLALPGALPPAMGAHRFGQTGLFVGLAIALIYWVLLSIACAAAHGIFVAALYRYATNQGLPPGFNVGDFSGVWQRKVY